MGQSGVTTSVVGAVGGNGNTNFGFFYQNNGQGCQNTKALLCIAF